jgi:N-methylhydantoinase A
VIGGSPIGRVKIVDERYRIGVDIGGTFTDFSVIDRKTNQVHVEKVLTTPSDPELAVFLGLEKLAEKLPDLFAGARDVIHATTLITNIVVEGKGAKTGLITTAGFRDILEMGRETRYTVFDMFIRYPPPLVPRNLRLGVAERTLTDGSIAEPLDEASLRKAIDVFRQESVDAVAICFLHSYRNPANEIRAAEIVRRELPGVDISLSHEVYPEPKEFERTSTTAVDAYVKRIIARYMDQLAVGLADRGFKNRVLIMLSNGGTATVATSKRHPVQVLESGPAAGVEAASFFGRMAGLDTMLAFDMGGTTAKLCIIEGGRAARTRAFEVARVHRFTAGSGYPISIPVYDLLEIGAGGGSIARMNDLGLLEVGPHSAGSKPGPVCYGLGGDQPTVTDADLVLGNLNADYFLGGDMRLDKAAAERAIQSKIAQASGLSTLEAAAGIFELVNGTMAAAARMYIAEKGKVADHLTLVASGGAGPVHAVDLARKLGVAHVIVPPFSGVMSSLGLLAAPIAFERSRAVNYLLDAATPAEIEKMFEALEAAAAEMLPKHEAMDFNRSLDLRYAGQDYPLEIPIGRPIAGAGAIEQWKAGFLKEYELLYGQIDEENPIELATLRVQVRQQAPQPQIERPMATADATAKAERDVYVINQAAVSRVPVYDRKSLREGQSIRGPAVIEERESTTVLGARDRLTVDANGCLSITVAPLLSDRQRDEHALSPAEVEI